MRIFIAGAAGAVGRRLTPALIQLGHQVIGMGRSKGKMRIIRASGATNIIDPDPLSDRLPGPRQSCRSTSVPKKTSCVVK